ncbi:MAG: Holliday junction branch migration protein RuvA [Clostridiales bacterium]|nr:Holliday junction branch migration protein RuvA [Clostridiales bacterium]
MFYYLYGTVAHIAPYLAVLDCGGVGYACKTTNFTLSTLHKGEKAKLYTHLAVKEDDVTLYGFATEEERNLFLLLLSVSGVGPKAALSILSTSSPSSLALAIITGDLKALTSAAGVGKKLAQRIVLELKDKLAKEQDAQFQNGGLSPANQDTVIPEDKLSEAGAALQVLGYHQNEINAALKGLDVSALTLEELVKQALKRLAK